ncbi:cytidine deaminase [Clostridia bacterium]|nr:cytidine deaminase [Clostridia bacterium]
MARISWDNYFMKMALLAAERSTCVRRQIGAVLVRDNQILATGYNGASAGLDDCLTLGCLRDELGIASGTRAEVCRAVHAEQNAIIQAAVHGVSIRGAVMYCTHSPCILCTKMMINARISRSVYRDEYSETEFKTLFDQAGIAYEKIFS